MEIAASSARTWETGVDQYIVQEVAADRYVIVAPGEQPLPATFDSREKAQAVADRLNLRLPSQEAVYGPPSRVST